jgi:hypothetical protein
VSELARKLQIREGQGVRVLHPPSGFSLDAPSAGDDPNAAVLVFVTTRTDLEARVGPVLAAARADRLAWIAYPKAGQLGTDLNRDLLWQALEGRGVRPVRQVAIDDIWSALRFRPA